MADPYPTPEGREELETFARLQAQLAPLFEHLLRDPRAPRTIVVVPSLSVDPEVLSRIDGVQHYEERMLCMLMFLRFPRTRIIYVTSTPVDPPIVDYYLHLLPGVPASHARGRLVLFHCHDASPTTVTSKIIDRPRLLERIRSAIDDADAAYMTCFNATTLERTLAVRLGIPLYACDPALAYLGSKSGSREVFREAGVLLPDGFERLRDAHDVATALVSLRRQNPTTPKAIVKLDEGVSGEGNATFDYEGCPSGAGLEDWVKRGLPSRLTFEAVQESWDHYCAKLVEMGGIVEAYVDGSAKRSPSVQCRLDPLGRIELISTHEQILGGPSGQIFLGSTFPADEEYRLDVQRSGARVAEVLKRHGALGRFGVDFVSVKRGSGWEHFAIEINLRKGGTTHTFMTLEFLTDGTYDPDTGVFRTPFGQERFYFATDNLQRSIYRRFTPEDLIDIAVDHDLYFNRATQQGVAFHLIGALSEFGKLGVVCIADTPVGAMELYRETIDVLNEEATTGRQARPSRDQG